MNFFHKQKYIKMLNKINILRKNFKLNKLPDQYSWNVKCQFEANFILIRNPSSLYGNTITD